MNIYIYEYIYIKTCVCVCMYIYTYIHTYIHTHIQGRDALECADVGLLFFSLLILLLIYRGAMRESVPTLAYGALVRLALAQVS